MHRPATRTLLLALFLALAGCGEETGPQTHTPIPESPQVHEDGRLPQATAMELDGEWWDRRPPIRILLAGGQRGLLKAWGCREPPLGGLGRMAAVLHQLQRRAEENGAGLAALAVGWSMRAAGEEQEEAKATYLRAVYEALGFSGVLLGATDLQVPAMCQPRGSGVEIPRPPLNVRLARVSPAADSTPFADFTVGQVPVRALSVVAPERAEALQALGLLDGVVSVSRAFEALQPRGETLWIVAGRFKDLAAARVVQAGLARLGPGVIVDVSEGGTSGVRRIDREPIAAGREPLVVALGAQGQAVGVLDLEPRPAGPGWLASYRRIALVPQWEKYGGPPARQVEVLDAVYRQVVRERAYLTRYPRQPEAVVRYVGSSACARCHAAIYNDWRRSAHAVALETLSKAAYDWDPECVRCHVVGWRRDGTDPSTWTLAASGFVSQQRTPYLGGVGCENCHGPGSAHVADPTLRSLFAAGGPNLARPDADTTCKACHDEENSHRFADAYAEEHLPRVDHRRIPADLKTVLPAEWRPAGK